MVAMLAALFTFSTLAGCGADAEPEPATSAAPVESSPPDGMEWEAAYPDPAAMLDELRAGGVECETESEQTASAYSDLTLFCYTVETRDDGYQLDTYASAEQQGDAHVYLSDLNPGVRYVWGTGWSVRLPKASDGSEVVATLGGEVSLRVAPSNSPRGP